MKLISWIREVFAPRARRVIRSAGDLPLSDTVIRLREHVHVRNWTGMEKLKESDLIALMEAVVIGEETFTKDNLESRISEAYLAGQEFWERQREYRDNPALCALMKEWERRYPLPEGSWYGMGPKLGLPARQPDTWIPWPLGQTLILADWVNAINRWTDSLGFRVIDLKEDPSLIGPALVCWLRTRHQWCDYIQDAGACNNPFPGSRYVHCKNNCWACKKVK